MMEPIPEALWADAQERLENHGGLSVWDADALFIGYLSVLSNEAIDWLASHSAGSGITESPCEVAAVWDRDGYHEEAARLHEVLHDGHLQRAHAGLTKVLYALDEAMGESGATSGSETEEIDKGDGIHRSIDRKDMTMASTDPQWRFDHQAAQEAAEERLAEFPVVARATDPDGDTYDPERVLPDRIQMNVAYLHVLVDQLEQDPRGTGGQLKHEIGQAIAGAYTTGHEAARDELLAYLAGLDEAEPWVLGSLLSSYQRTESDG